MRRSALPRRTGAMLLLPLLLAFAATSAVRAQGTTTARDALPVVRYEARDYAFVGPDTLESGPFELRLANAVGEMHNLLVVRIDEGHSVRDAVSVLTSPGPTPPWLRLMGGPNSPGPRGESAVELDLAPGRYLFLCLIASPDGRTHVDKGMLKEVTVVPARRDRTVLAATDLTLALVDYDFVFSEPLRRGTQRILVTNTAEQPHEIFLAKLIDGAAPADFMSWLQTMDGPPPMQPIGGVTSLSKGAHNVWTVSLTPGDYALYCFTPDGRDGQPHFTHGMLKKITVK